VVGRKAKGPGERPAAALHGRSAQDEAVPAPDPEDEIDPIPDMQSASG
jgi:hypothetical protein